MNKILKLLLKAFMSKPKSTYRPRYKGQWKNKGTDRDEDWVWVEKTTPIRQYKVCVFNIEDDYIITVGTTARANAIEVVDCESGNDIDRALRILSAYYNVLGNVVIDRES